MTHPETGELHTYNVRGCHPYKLEALAEAGLFCPVFRFREIRLPASFVGVSSCTVWASPRSDGDSPVICRAEVVRDPGYGDPLSRKERRELNGKINYRRANGHEQRWYGTDA